MATTPVPKFPAGGGHTCHASAAITGGRFVAQTTTVPNGGNRVIGVPTAAGRVCGVAGEDIASGAKGNVWGPGQQVWVEAAATLAPGDLVEASATGTAAVRSAGIVCGEVIKGNTVGLLALIDFRPAFL